MVNLISEDPGSCLICLFKLFLLCDSKVNYCSNITQNGMLTHVDAGVKRLKEYIMVN